MPPAADPLAALILSNPGANSVLATFLLFVIPTGAGIPAGVLLGQRLGLTAASLSGLYIGSGLLRAVLFEPVFRWAAARRHEGGRIGRLRDAAHLFLSRSPMLARAMRGSWAPLIVGYNLDPMAGRVAAAAVGMGWLRGWTLSLIADFAYFVTTAVPTIWMQRVVGNEWVTLLLLMILSAVVPLVWRRLRGTPAAA